jgi:protein-disulfide isomerase
MTDTPTPAPGFRAALSNRTILMTIGALALTTAAASVALLLQGSGSVQNRAAIEQVVREYILEHPEILPEAMDRLKAKQTGALIDAHRTAIETPFAGAWEGAEKGDVVLVEFFDYACGYCRAALPEIAKLVSENKDLKVVYRELPILSDESVDAAKVSQLAAEKRVYQAYHRELYAAGQVTRATILASAEKAGLDRKAAEAAMTDKRYDKEIASNLELAQDLQVRATPTFVIGNQVLEGALGYDALKKAIADARAK